MTWTAVLDPHSDHKRVSRASSKDNDPQPSCSITEPVLMSQRSIWRWETVGLQATKSLVLVTYYL